MKFAVPVKNGDVISCALELVTSSKKEIIATMDIAEELVSPLPAPYYKSLKEAKARGVSIIRLGFGQLNDFQFLLNSMDRSTFTDFVYGGHIERYQRMLIIDGKKGLCGIGDQVIFSEFPPFIVSLVKYCKMIYNQQKELKNEKKNSHRG